MAPLSPEQLTRELELTIRQLRAATARISELESQLAQETAYRHNLIRAEADLRQLTGESTAMKAVRHAIQQVAKTDRTVLIFGETGTGKELVARAVHQLSRRRERLLVKVNGAALTPSLMTSELFGHEKGAFTGAAKRRVGRFEMAHGGTLFLDEVGELPPETQVLLLRVLQERIVERVGGNEPVPVDVRLIAATHRDLQAAVATGRFRADLYYRLHVFPICLPPLRDRREDLPSLIRHFITHYNRHLGKQVTDVAPTTLELLRRYDWPGNIRELENVIERAMIITQGERLEIDPSWLIPPSLPPLLMTTSHSLAETEKQAIRDALRQSRGKIYGSQGAAAKLGLKPTTLYGKMRKWKIDKDGEPLSDRAK
ncbi:MAG: sigma-54 dependent transcriptional regulator [Candidatus Sumerlaeaceae bacterium]|nr:sigma-54 dependent transcriptional regulator [Candidatus Sumerlaeaceae bacterium]